MVKAIFVFGSGHPHKKNGAINLGDVAQLKNGLNIVRKLFPESKIIVLANSSKEMGIDSNIDFRTEIATSLGSGREYKVGFFYNLTKIMLMIIDAILLRIGFRAVFSDKPLRMLMSEFSRAQFLLFTGAGAINQRYLKGPAGMWLLTAFIARILHIPVVALGQQVGPFNDNLWNKVMLRMAFGKSLFFGCRDHESVQLLSKVGINRSAVFFSGDEGAYFPPSDNELAALTLNELGCNDGFLAVHFRLDGNSLFSEHIKSYAEKIEGVAKALDKRILFFPMAYHGENNDERAIDQIRKVLRISSNIINCEDPALLKACLQKADGAIGVANHFVVFCASVGVPTLAIYSTPYMKQKLIGAEQAYPYVRAIDIKDLESADFDEMLKTAKSCVTDDDKTAYQRLPADYWQWLDRLEAAGVNVNRKNINQ